MRSPLPARVAYEILQLCLCTTNTHTLRRCAGLSVAFAWFARADTGILMRCAHVTRQTYCMGLNERTKTVALHLAAPIWRAQSWEHDPVSVFNKLFERWENSQNHAPDDCYWSTSNDNYTDTQWRPTLIGNWLSEILLILNIYTVRQFSVRSVSLAIREFWVSPTRLARDLPLTICVCYCVSYCISLFQDLLSVRSVCACLQERAISRRTRSFE